MIVPQCPKCEKDYVRRASRRGLLERLLGRFYLYPFRCQLCGHRFWFRQPGVRYKRVIEDRREYDRIHVRYDATLAANQARSPGVVTEISMGGCTVETEARLAPKAVLGLEITTPGQARPIVIEAGVVRTVRSNSVGIEFLRFRDDERMRLQRVVQNLIFDK